MAFTLTRAEGVADTIDVPRDSYVLEKVVRPEISAMRRGVNAARKAQTIQ